MTTVQIAVGLVFGLGVGMMLMGSKSKTAKPDSMPNVNSATRGNAVPVSFGSNRLYAQVGWTKNFKANRAKASGKGGAKGGGSGGFGSAKGGGSAAQNYEYFWDMIFHFGVVDQPVLIRQGWVGDDPIDAPSLNNLTAGLSNTVQGLFPVVKASPDTTPAKLTFTEAFTAPGYPTGSTSLESWAYFQSQENVDCAFPSQAWVGFNQLDLGQAPTVPQLSFEFVPLATGITAAPVFKISPADRDGQAEPFLKDDNGLFYYFAWDSGGDTSDRHRAQLYREDGAAEIFILNSRWESDRDALGLQGDCDWAGNCFIPGTKYFYMFGRKLATPSIYIGILYSLNGDGTITRQGGFDYASEQTVGGFLGGCPSDNPVSVRRMNDGSVKMLYHADGAGGSSDGSRTFIATLPDPEGLLGNTTMIDHAGSPDDYPWDRIILEITTVGSNFLFMGSNRTTGSLHYGITECGVLSYIGQAEMDWHGAHSSSDTFFCPYVGSIRGSHGHGALVMIPFTDSVSIVSDNVLAVDGKTKMIPFTDRQHNSVGAPTTNAWDDYGPPTQWGDYITWGRGFSDDFLKAKILLFSLTIDSDGKPTLRLLNSVTNEIASISDVAPNNVMDSFKAQVDLDTSVIYTEANYAGTPNDIMSKFGAFTLSDTDVAPAYIIYRILTSDVFGFATTALFGYSITAERIDQDSYAAALAQNAADGIKVSVTYTQNSDLLTILQELLEMSSAFLVDHGGKIYFGQVTGTDEPIRTLDNNHFVVTEKNKPPVQTQQAALEDGYNEIHFGYLDRALAYNPNEVVISDEVDYDFNGPRIKTYTSRYVMAGSTATLIATRALWNNLYGKDQYDFNLGRKDSDLMPGDLVTLVDSFDEILKSGVRARLTNWENPNKGVYKVHAVREFPHILTASGQYSQVSSIDAGFGGLVQDVQPMLRQTAYELPQEFQGAKAHVYFGYNQGFSAMGAQLYISTDGANYPLVQDVQPHIISAVLNTPLENRAPGYVETGVDFYLFPTSNFHTNSPVFVQEYDLDDITTAMRAAGLGTFIVGSEAIAFENLTLLGQNHYRAKYAYRGWGGTPISAHNSGDFFHQHASGIFAVEISEDKIGTNWSYKIAGYNFAGTVEDISSISASSYTIQGVYWLPRILPRINLFVSSALAWNPNTPVVGPYINVVSGGCDVSIGWTRASNTDGFGAGGYGAGGFGHWEPDVTGISLPDYRVEVQSLNGTTVRSTVVYSGYFDYTRAMNTADFGSFAHDLIFKVTPFNAKGDGPVGDIRSLHIGGW